VYEQDTSNIKHIAFPIMITTEQTLTFITYVLIIYVGCFIVITDLIENIINILVFIQLKLFRRNLSALYLSSCINC
jgi:hypothetical protein